MTVRSVLYECHFIAASYSAQDAGPQRHSFPQRVGSGTRFRSDLDVFGRVIQDADTDVVELKVLLDFRDNLRQHLLGIFTGDGGLGNIIQKTQLAGAPLFFAKQTRILHSHRNLTAGCA